MASAVVKTDSQQSAGTKAGAFWRSVVAGAATVAVIAVLALAIALAVVPRLMGGHALTVLSGSMEPTYSPGDMVVSVPKDHYSIGDAVTFQPKSNDPTLITHRIVGMRSGGDVTSYVTRGDANGADDDPIKAGQIMGKVMYSVPYVGHFNQAVGRHKNQLVTLAAIGLIGYAVFMFGSDALTKRQKPKTSQSD